MSEHTRRRARLEQLLTCSAREPYGWPVPISRDDLKVLLRHYGRQHRVGAPQDPEYVRRILFDRDVKGLTFDVLGHKYGVTKAAAYLLCTRWREWASKNPVDKPTRA